MPSPSPAPSYHSSTDSSFAGSSSVDSQSDTSARTPQRGEVVDSGDEGVIGAGKRKRKRGKGKGKKKGKSGEKEELGDGEDDEGGVGERVRARREGRDIKKRQPIPSVTATTIDIDDLWAKMNRAPQPVVLSAPQTVAKPESKDSEIEGTPAASSHHEHVDNPTGTKQASGAKTPLAEETIAIKRTYVFAGETITEEKVVPKSSAEARLYLESQSAASNPSISGPGTRPRLRRPKKRVMMFDPKPDAAGNLVSPLSGASKAKGAKLNTIEKSKLDWAGYVDKEGIKEELDVAEKAKDGYLGKMDFLGRVDAKREDDRLNAKKKR